MTNFLRRPITKHEHAAGGCGCGSHHAHEPATHAAAHTDEGCCPDHGAKAVEEHALSVESDREHASRHEHGSCCGGHSAKAPENQPAARERNR